MLHVTNGSVVLARIHDLGIGGAVIPWDDVLHDGPVPAGLDPAALRQVRAAFLAGVEEAGRLDEIAQTLEMRDRALDRREAGDEVVLWFEHDLYDQLQLLQVLDRLDGCRLTPDAAQPTAIFADDYLGAQTDERLRTWFEARRPLSRVEWEAAAEAWRLFRAPDPTGLARFDHPGAWPAMRSSFRRHLQQFPSVHSGLSRTEEQTLAALTDGARTPRDLHAAATHGVDEPVFLGDWGWWIHVASLLSCPRPLLRLEGTAPGGFQDPTWWQEDDGAPTLAITDDGRRVASGELDHIAINGIDRWLGGVHLEGRGPLWRWDEARGIVEWRD